MEPIQKELEFLNKTVIQSRSPWDRMVRPGTVFDLARLQDGTGALVQSEINQNKR